MIMATPHTIISIPVERPEESRHEEPEFQNAKNENSSNSWVPSWFPGSPLRTTLHEKPSTSKPSQMELEELDGATSSQRKMDPNEENSGKISQKTENFSSKKISQNENSGKIYQNENLPSKEFPNRQDSVTGREQPINTASGSKAATQKTEERPRKSKAAPPVPNRNATVHTESNSEKPEKMEKMEKGKINFNLEKKTEKIQNNFSYDTLKERADTWKKERSKRPTRPIPEREDSFVDKIPDLSRKHIEFMEDTDRPKIRFTQEESDKIDKDILRLMGALQHNKYPFNRDKHLLFNKLRLIRRKQMGLLFAHRELDGTGYFHTDREEFGYDVISGQLGTMYNVIDAISRDVYELRELLYYERKNQTPPTRRGSSERRTSSEPPPLIHITNPISFPTRAGNAPLSSYDGIDGGTLSTAPTLLAPSIPKTASSPTRPILKHSTSVESFKSAKSDDTVTE